MNRDTILIVDDMEVNRAILHVLFEQEYNLLEAENGEQALMLIKQYRESLAAVLLDVVMPVMDGYQATEAIRRSGRPRAQTIPIIAMTADAFHEDVVQALAAGMDGHLSKSIDPNLLYQTLADMLSKND